MAQTSKTYRGQGRNKDRDHIGCGCFLCTGKDRGNQYVVDKQQAKIEVKQIMDNFVLDPVILSDQVKKEEYNKGFNDGASATANDIMSST